MRGERAGSYPPENLYRESCSKVYVVVEETVDALAAVTQLENQVTNEVNQTQPR